MAGSTLRGNHLTEFWTTNYVEAGQIATTARIMEARGWDGLAFTDSQNNGGEVFSALAIAAAVTEGIGLGTAVTNVSTRQLAVIASAAATIQAESDGRFTLGVGRGDSALANLGLHPPNVSSFGARLGQLRGYLHHETVTINGVTRPLVWLEGSDAAPVPIDVAATGPQTIAAGARVADSVSFAMGANTARISDGIDHAKRSAEAAGRPIDQLRIGAYVTVGAHDDPSVARRAVEGSIGTQAHFSGMVASTAATLPDEDRSVVEALAADYDLARHGHGAADHLAHLTDDFVDRFAIVGPPEECLNRLGALLELLPLDRLYVSTRSRGVDPGLVDEVAAVTAAEVIGPLQQERR